MTLILAFLISMTSAMLHISIPMIEIKLLTLEAGRMTAARRSAAIPQLECSGVYCTSDLMPQTVQCHNIGAIGQEVQWRCDAELDNKVKFGRIEISCEGFEFTGDWNVLNGSCALAYELVSNDPDYQSDEDVVCVEDFEWGDNVGFTGDDTPPTKRTSTYCYRKPSRTQTNYPNPSWFGGSTMPLWIGLGLIFLYVLFADDTDSHTTSTLSLGRRHRRYFHSSRSSGWRSSGGSSFRSSGGSSFRSSGGSRMASGFGGSRSR